jgi:hypothetical protein
MPLHVLGINPTFSQEIHSRYGMLDPDCPSMGLVVDCGLTGDKCYGTDLFPLHVDIDYLQATDRPFDDFPQFEHLFLSRHLDSFLNIGGKVLLVFGGSAFDTLASRLRLKDIKLSDPYDDLCIFWEKVRKTARVMI